MPAGRHFDCTLLPCAHDTHMHVHTRVRATGRKMNRATASRDSHKHTRHTYMPRVQGRPLLSLIIGVLLWQFDILFEVLTAAEHLRLFAALKGLAPDSVEVEVQRRLEEVRLADVSNRAAGSFSGGMKRRLSVAISLMGNPRVVFMDEPTTGARFPPLSCFHRVSLSPEPVERCSQCLCIIATCRRQPCIPPHSPGMDPISRRHVWDVIEQAKQDRAIILTTHSMEEGGN